MAAARAGVEKMERSWSRGMHSLNCALKNVLGLVHSRGGSGGFCFA